MSESLRTTPLHDEHLRSGAKMVPFAGYSMPIQYAGGIRQEHRKVREEAGLFDVSHMGEFKVSGPDALGLVQHVTVNDVSRLVVGQAQYSVICREDGGVLDDILVYRLGDTSYLVVVNAANRDQDWQWIGAHRSGFDAKIEDQSDDTALLALQGPRSEEILTSLVDVDLGPLGFYHSTPARISGVPALVARSGYTGEDGFELFLPSDAAVKVWNDLLEAGAGAGLTPVGLGARDSLRLEVGYPLCGVDLDEEHTALESGLGWMMRAEKKEDFLGRAALMRQREAGVPRRLAGIELQETGFPRSGYPVVANGEVVGEVTSGTVSPSLDKGIALAYLPTELSSPGTLVSIRVRDREVAGEVRRLPFYTRGSRKR